MNRRRLAGAAAALWAICGGLGSGAETDNLTYRYVRLEDSASKLNLAVNGLLEELLRKTNDKLSAGGADPRKASDTEVELAFFKTYAGTALKKVGDRLLPVMESCVERNDCPGWPRFERIVLEGTESTYGQARYNRIAITFLSPSFQLCGVRMGTDKLTHLFSHGFLYFNAVREGRAGIETEEDARRVGLADERGLMGVYSTAVVSPADAEAAAAGFRLARDYFLGDDPLFSRVTESGLLQKRRDLDLCAYVSQDFDEEVNRPSFTARRARVERLEAAIRERRSANELAERTLTPDEKTAAKDRVVRRALPPGHGRLPWLYKIYIVFKYGFAYLTMPKESRAAASYLAFPDFKLKDRRPIVLRHEPARPPRTGSS